MGIDFNFNLNFDKRLDTSNFDYSSKTSNISEDFDVKSKNSPYTSTESNNSNNVEVETLDLDSEEFGNSGSNNSDSRASIDFSLDKNNNNIATTENTAKTNNVDSNIDITEAATTNTNSSSSNSTNNQSSIDLSTNETNNTVSSKNGQTGNTTLGASTSSSEMSHNSSSTDTQNTSGSSQGNIKMGNGEMASAGNKTNFSTTNDKDTSSTESKTDITMKSVSNTSKATDTLGNISDTLDMEKVNITVEDYLGESEKLYLEELDQNIDNYEEIIEMLQQKIKDYESLNVNGLYYKQLYEEYQNTLQSIDSYWINEKAAQYQIYCSDEKAKELGVSPEELMYMPIGDIFKLIQEKDSEYQKAIENAKEQKIMLDEEVKKGTGLESYEEYTDTLNAWKKDLATFSAALYQTKQLKKTAKYNLLGESLADKEIKVETLEKDIANKSIKQNRYGWKCVDYNTYKENGGKLSPLEFVKQTADAYPDYEISVEDRELLESLVGYSEEDESAGKIYEYLYYENPDLAKQYLIDTKADLNAYAGSKQAEQFLDSLSKNENGEYNSIDILNHLKVTGKGLGDGVEQFGEGMINFGDLVLSCVGLGSKDDHVYSVNEYETMYILQALQAGKIQTSDEESSQQSNPLNLLDDNYQISQSIGNMAPSMAIGILLSPVAGTALMGASAGGGSYHQALVEGKDKGKAIAYGVLSGASEAVLERYLGKIPGLSKIMDDGVKMTLVEFTKRMASEGIEEGTQEWIDSFMRTGLFKEEFDVSETAKKSLKSGMYGAITAMITNGGTTAVNYAISTVEMRQIANDLSNSVIDDLIVYKQSLDENGNNLKLDEYVKNKENGGDINPEFEKILFAKDMTDKILKKKANHEEVNVDDLIPFDSSEVNANSGRVAFVGATPSEMAQDLNTIIKLHDKNYGDGSAIEQLKKFLDPNSDYYNNYNVITKSDNARAILKKYSFTEIQTMVKNYEMAQDFKTIIEFHDTKYGDGNTLARLKAILDPNSEYYGNYNIITSSGNARTILKKYSLNEIESMVKNYEMSKNLGDIIDIQDNEMSKNSENVIDIQDNETGNESVVIQLKNIFNRAKAHLKRDNAKQSTNDSKNLISFDINNKTGSNVELYNFFEKFSKVLDNYGVDQGFIENMCIYINDGIEYTYRQARYIVNKLIQENKVRPGWIKEVINEDYNQLKNKLMIKGFSESDASVILSSINNSGACAYAATCNEIFYQFRNAPEKFEEIFGYKMYKETNNGVVLNSGDLLLDLYLYANDTKNGGTFIDGTTLLNLSNTVDVFGRKLLDSNNQVGMSNYISKNASVIDSFLKSKSPNLHYKSSTILSRYGNIKIETQEDANELNRVMKNELDEGNSLTIDIAYYKAANDKVINLICVDDSNKNVKTNSWEEGDEEGGGHSMLITGVAEDGLYVSSWGSKYFIPMEDLIGSNFGLYSSKIESS